MISKRTGLLEAIQVPSSPFPGLRPFEFQESHLFFGRDGQIEKLLDKLIRTRFLAVVGTSGSRVGEILSRGATVDGGEGKTDECSDELTTISTVAPRLDNHSLPQPALKRRPKLNRRSATKKRLPGNAKDLGNDKFHSRATATFRTRNRNSL